MNYDVCLQKIRQKWQAEYDDDPGQSEPVSHKISHCDEHKLTDTEEVFDYDTRECSLIWPHHFHTC